MDIKKNEIITCKNCGFGNKHNAYNCKKCGIDLSADIPMSSEAKTNSHPTVQVEEEKKLDGKAKRRRAVLLSAALILGAPTLILTISGESVSSGTAIGQYIGGFFWGFLIGCIAKAFRSTTSLADYAIGGGLILNGATFGLLVLAFFTPRT